MTKAVRGALGALLVAALLVGCSSSRNPQKVADDMTHALYANDLDRFSGYFDDATKATVTRSDMGALSDRMHKLGDLQSIAPHDADPDAGRYTYDVTLSRGTMLVELRIDPTGKVGAYRVVPPSTTPHPASTH
jgi:hypothetical protein